jgi:hypothetical protein
MAVVRIINSDLLQPLDRLLRSRFGPMFAAVCAVAIYMLLLLPILLPHHFDLSVFIVAGDRFVDASHTPTPLYVRNHSDGYDGQFYYGIALNPFADLPVNGGVTLDHPAWRIQRIIYPLLAYLAAFAHPAWIPFTLFAVNLGLLFAIALLITLHCRWERSTLIPALAILGWPGFLTTLTHDTTEITASFLLLAAILAYLHESFLLFAVLGAIAALARETSSLMLAGILTANLSAACLSDKPARFLRNLWQPSAAAALALVTFLTWRVWLAWALHPISNPSPAMSNLALPFFGLIGRITSCCAELFITHESLLRRLLALNTLIVAVVLVGYSILMASSACRVARRCGRNQALTAAWFLIMILMSTLSANGPWIDATAILRAFSEAWVLGWLIISLDRKELPWIYLLPLVVIAVSNILVCRINVG